jgi:hypothetical protein
LSLRSSPVSGTGFASFGGKLQHLYLHELPLTPAGMSAIGKLPRLRFISATAITLTASHLAGLAACNLESAQFAHNRLGDQALEPLTRIATLKKLVVADNQLTPRCFETIERMKALRELGLQANPQVREADVKTLAARLPALKIVSDHGTFGPKERR